MYLTKELADELFRAFNIQRWNDRLRPMHLYEMDKHSLKMIIAYCLGRYEEDRGCEIDWIKIIKYGIYELFRRIVISDIKSPIYDQIRKNDLVFEQLNKYIFSEIKYIIPHQNILEDIEKYLFMKPNEADINTKILDAAHNYASYLEFNTIYTVNSNSYQNFRLQTELLNKLSRHKELIGMQKFMNKESISNFVDLCGQLRFQIRWSQTPRIPETTVLGHCLMVAIFSYFMTIQYTNCPKRIYNNFFCGIFHDLPEVATRDIISPVKRISEELQNLISNIEKQLSEEEIYPLLEANWVEEFKYFTEDEFSNKIIDNGKIISGLRVDEINEKYDECLYSPMDGEIVRAADKFAAFLEAFNSCEIGIKSKELVEAVHNIKNDYKNKKIANIDFDLLYRNYNSIF